MWQQASYDLMSEEEDEEVNGRVVWMVSPPPRRGAMLSALCQVLEGRRQGDTRNTFHPRMQRDAVGQRCSVLGLLNSP